MRTIVVFATLLLVINITYADQKNEQGQMKNNSCKTKIDEETKRICTCCINIDPPYEYTCCDFHQNICMTEKEPSCPS